MEHTNEEKELLELYDKLKERKMKYWLLDFKAQDYQEEVMNAVSAKNDEWFPLFKYLLFQWGNGSWKTAIAMYIVALLALWETWAKYNLPYIGTKRQIYVGTKSGFTLQNNILKYLRWNYSVTKIPDEEIKTEIKDNGGIKKIILQNWNEIIFFTYDQGRETLQGTNGDFYVYDEEPLKEGVFAEGIARIRTWTAQILLSFTPLSGYTAAYEWFYEQENEKIKNQSYIQVVNSLKNVHADNSWLEGLSEQERKMRLEWLFIPPSWLVYPQFNRDVHCVEWLNPHELPDVRFYWAVDFWVNHPTAFAFIAVDSDEHVFIFDLIHESNMLIKDLASLIKEKARKWNIDFEYIVADAAGKRERTELESYWIQTKPADKWSKGENDMSNRKTGIMKVNQMLHDQKIFLDSELKPAIKEFESHSYKEWGKRNWDTDKINDDFLDALRYFIFSYKPVKTMTTAERKYRDKWNEEYSRKKKINLTNSPY